MTKLIKTTIILIGISFSLNLHGQEDYDITPPSPEASSVGKFGEFPISLYTGTPNIDIPLFGVQSGRIVLPIQLSYHASGIKVEESPSRVGQGWTLNAGGVITRSIRGLADEFYLKKTTCGYYDNEIGDCYKLGHFFMENLPATADPFSEYDSDADLFYYSFAGKNGKFIFKENKTPFFFNRENIKLEHPFGQPGEQSTNLPGQFKLTDDDGIIYTFSEPEKVVSPFEYNHYNAWYLTDIYDPLTTRRVTISYADLGTVEVFQNSNYAYLDKEYQSCQIGLSSNIEYERYIPQSRNRSMNLKVISRIDFDEGYILFKSDHDREDSNGDKAITEIKQYDFNNNLIKSYQFNYSYSQKAGCSDPLSCKRLILDGITPKDKFGISESGYEFTYNNLNNLPSKISPEQDAWGYYNPNSASNFVPEIHVYKSLGKDHLVPFPIPNKTRDFIIAGANRQCNNITSVYGTIKRITYPTGGYTEFEFEPNVFDFHGSQIVGGGIRLKKRINYTDNQIYDESYQYFGGKILGLIPQFSVYNAPWNSSASQLDYENNLLRFGQNQAVLGVSNGSYVGYDRVVKTNVNATGVDIGKTEYFYSNIADDQPSYEFYGTQTCEPSFANYSRYPFYNTIDNSHLRGKILKEVYYERNSTTPIKEVNYEYQSYEDITGQLNNPFVISNGLWINNRMYDASSIKVTYSNYNEQLVPSTVTDIEYDQNQIGKTTNKEYTYKDNYLVESESTDDLKVSYQYPEDFSITASSGIIGEMLIKNYINTPIVTQKWKNDKLINESIINFSEMNGLIVPSEIYKTKIPAPLNSDDVYVITDPGNLNSNLYDLEVEFQNYDSKGRLLQAKSSNDITYKYMWHDWRQDKYPSAKVIGQAGYVSIATCDVTSGALDASVVVGGSKAGRGYCNSPASVELWKYTGSTGGTPLRVSFWARNASLTLSNSANSQNVTTGSTWEFVSLEMPADTYLKLNGSGNIDEFRVYRYDNTQITTYDYENLIGIKSVNDPTGDISKYEYDSMGRLMFIQDASGNIIKAFKYNLK